MSADDPYPSIGSYALLSDCHSAALVSRDGSVDWCCFHRFDARPVFARLLDWNRGGYFRLAPAGAYTVNRRYLPGTNILETRFAAEGGVLRVTDFLPVGPAADPATGRITHPYHQLIRLVRCDEGSVEVAMDFAPRFDYGRTTPRLETRGRGLAVAYGGADALVFQCGIPFTPTGVGDCSGRTVMRAGEETSSVLTYALPHELRARRLPAARLRERLAATVRFWSEWSARCRYEGPYREAVLRSALVLKGLINSPTGAVVAAPTTSLPEEVGGPRNWDYRYTWLRDSALTLYALFTLGYTDEAHAFMRWLQRTTAGRVEDVQIMYGVGGERFLPEVELSALEGFRGSRPVRIGNAAADQMQLDAYGYLVDTAWLYHRHGGEIDPTFWAFLRDVVDLVATQWVEPDHGIWEFRDRPRHFVLSKVLAWVAVDRAIRLARARGLPADLPHWVALRRRIRQETERSGVDPALGAFVQAFDAPVPDASNLLIPLLRFLPADDPRVRATRGWIERELSRDGLVFRYLAPDGLPGDEGAFVICSWWLVENLALAGEVTRAEEAFTRLLGFANDLGLLAEEIDPHSGEHLGNFPQAFSHVGLIGAAMNLEKARRARALG